jgi:hypothetical protein
VPLPPFAVSICSMFQEPTHAGGVPTPSGKRSCDVAALGTETEGGASTSSNMPVMWYGQVGAGSIDAIGIAA